MRYAIEFRCELSIVKRALRIGKDLYFIRARETFMTGPDSNVFVISDEKEGLTLIDVGSESSFDLTKQAIEALGFKITDVKRVILTHSHYDHSGGIPELFKHIKPEIWVSAKEALFLEKGDDMVVLGALLGGALPPLKIHKSLRSNDTIVIGDYNLDVLETPGHSVGSLCFWDKTKQILFSGDTVFCGGSFGRVDFPTGDAKQLKQSLTALAELKIDMLLPGHMDIAVKDGYKHIQAARQIFSRLI